MILGPTDLLQILLGATVSSKESYWIAAYMEFTGGPATVTVVKGLTSGTTPATVINTGDYERNLLYFSLRNDDSAACNVILETKEAFGDNRIGYFTIPVDAMLHYERGAGWYITDSNGGRNG